MTNLFIQDSSNSGANVKRLDQESNDQMKEILKNIAAKKKEVSCANIDQVLPLSCTWSFCALRVSRNQARRSQLCTLQVMDKLLGYVTEVNFKAGATHM